MRRFRHKSNKAPLRLKNLRCNNFNFKCLELNLSEFLKNKVTLTFPTRKLRFILDLKSKRNHGTQRSSKKHTFRNQERMNLPKTFQ